MKLSEKTLHKLAQWLVTHPKLVILGVIVYFLSPFDVIPEILTGPLGYLDDFVVMLAPFIVRAYAQHLKQQDSHDAGSRTRHPNLE